VLRRRDRGGEPLSASGRHDADLGRQQLRARRRAAEPAALECRRYPGRGLERPGLEHRRGILCVSAVRARAADRAAPARAGISRPVAIGAGAGVLAGAGPDEHDLGLRDGPLRRGLLRRRCRVSRPRAPPPCRSEARDVLRARSHRLRRPVRHCRRQRPGQRLSSQPRRAARLRPRGHRLCRRGRHPVADPADAAVRGARPLLLLDLHDPPAAADPAHLRRVAARPAAGLRLGRLSPGGLARPAHDRLRAGGDPDRRGKLLLRRASGARSSQRAGAAGGRGSRRVRRCV